MLEFLLQLKKKWFLRCVCRGLLKCSPVPLLVTSLLFLCSAAAASPGCDGGERGLQPGTRALWAWDTFLETDAAAAESACVVGLRLRPASRSRSASRDTFTASRLFNADVPAPADLSGTWESMVNRATDHASAAPLFMKKDFSGTPSEPDISDPGPDMGNYPNSAYTLRQGRSYVESAPFGYQTGNSQSPAAWNWPFLLRYGLTDDVELRLAGNGLTSLDHSPDGKAGFAPLILDTKIHLWDDQMDRFIPAASLEAYVQTNWGSAELRGGVQPSLNLNLDFPFTDATNVEMTLGYTGVLADVQVNQFSCQWAIEQQLTDPLQLFVHGYYLAPAGSLDFSHVIGVGGFYQLSQQTTLFTSFNAAIDHNSPPFSTQLGIAFAF